MEPEERASSTPTLPWCRLGPLGAGDSGPSHTQPVPGTIVLRGRAALSPSSRQLQDSRYWERSLSMGSSMVQALLRWWTEQKAALNGTWKLLSSVRDPPRLSLCKRGAVSLSCSSEQDECLCGDLLAGSAPPETPLPQCCCLGGWEAAVSGCFCLGPARKSTACSCSEGGQG